MHIIGADIAEQQCRANIIGPEESSFLRPEPYSMIQLPTVQLGALLQAQIFRPREHFTPGFFYEMTKNLKQILEGSNHPGASRVSFDKHDLEVTVDVYLKSEDQGKGFTAYFNTVLMIALHMYLNRNSPHAPGFLVIDTPFHGFDQGKHEPDRSMSRGLINQLVKLGEHQQVIILENTDKLVDVELSKIEGVQEFSKDRDSGRYGYLDDVWDSGEEPLE